MSVRESYVVYKGDRIVEGDISQQKAMEIFNALPTPKRPSEVPRVYKLVAEKGLKW
jgi:hypothetical protein